MATAQRENDEHLSRSGLELASAVVVRCFKPLFEIAATTENNRRGGLDASSLWEQIQPNLSELAFWCCAGELLPNAVLRELARASESTFTVCGITGESAHKAILWLGVQTLLPFIAAVEELGVIPRFTEGPTLARASLIFSQSTIAKLREARALPDVGYDISESIIESVNRLLASQIDLIVGHLEFLSPLAGEDAGEFLRLMAQLDRERDFALEHGAASANGQLTPKTESPGNGQTDRKTDKIRRPLNDAARRCGLAYRRAREKNPDLRLKTFCTGYAEEHGDSFATLYRTLTDHPAAWQPDGQTDKPADKAV